MKSIRYGLRKLELYEIVGILVSIVCAVVFFAYGSALDAKQGVPGWHWRPLLWIWAIYRAFLPKAFFVALVSLLLIGLLRQRNLQKGLTWGLLQTGSVVRFALPFCVLLIIYRAVNFYIPLFSPVDRDAWLLASDHFLFGTQPSIYLQRWITPHLTDFFSFFYMAWFPAIFVTLLLMMLKSREAVTGYATSVLFAFYIAYFCYNLVPAIGPVYTLQHQYTINLTGGALTSLQKGVVTSDLSIPRDCFPSLHTAISCVMVYYIGRYWRPLLWLYLPLGLGILASTIYLRYHYFTDLIFGIVLAVLMCRYGFKWNKYWQDTVQRKGADQAGTTLPVQETVSDALPLS